MVELLSRSSQLSIQPSAEESNKLDQEVEVIPAEFYFRPFVD